MAQQARKSKSRKRRRRRSRGGTSVVLVLLCLVIAIAAILTAVTVFFKVRQFKLTGNTRYTLEEIVEASGMHQGDNLVLFNKFAVIDKMFDAFPYLDEVQIRRRLPDTVEILVTDCKPAAVLQDTPATVPDPKDKKGEKMLQIGNTGSWLIDRNGKLLEKAGAQSAGKLTLVRGVTLWEPQVGTYAKFSDEDVKKPLLLLLNTAEEDGILQNIGEMDFSEQYNIRFTYTDRFTVNIGSTENLSKKLRYLHLIVEEKLGTNAVGVLDISDTQKARFVPKNN